MTIDNMKLGLEPLVEMLNSFEEEVREPMLATLVGFLLDETEVSDQFKVATLEKLKFEILLTGR